MSHFIFPAGNVVSAEALLTLRSVLGVLQLLVLCVHQHMEENVHINVGINFRCLCCLSAGSLYICIH